MKRISDKLDWLQRSGAWGLSFVERYPRRWLWAVEMTRDKWGPGRAHPEEAIDAAIAASKRGRGK